jgi:hypothetical protein
MAADCKSADSRLRRFKSYPIHHFPFEDYRADIEIGGGTTLTLAALPGPHFYLHDAAAGTLPASADLHRYHPDNFRVAAYPSLHWGHDLFYPYLPDILSRHIRKHG